MAFHLLLHAIEDFLCRVCLRSGVIEKGETVPCPVDDDGRFTPEVSAFQGLHVKEADKPILAHLKTTGLPPTHLHTSLSGLLIAWPVAGLCSSTLIHVLVPQNLGCIIPDVLFP